eukprot:1151724-Pelagomonas_calceolata.AAC.4
MAWLLRYKDPGEFFLCAEGLSWPSQKQKDGRLATCTTLKLPRPQHVSHKRTHTHTHAHAHTRAWHAACTTLDAGIWHAACKVLDTGTWYAACTTLDAGTWHADCTAVKLLPYSR